MAKLRLENGASSLNLMPEDNHISLIIPPSSGLSHVRQQGGRILSEMVSQAKAEARKVAARSKSIEQQNRFKLGEHEFCEPDYQQILQWAQALKMEPLEVVRRLIFKFAKLDAADTDYKNGRIIGLGWDFFKLPLRSFWLNDDVIVEDLRLSGLQGSNWISRLSSSTLIRLNCSNNHFTALDLSHFPRLNMLDCCYNSLDELDLSHLSQLTELDCDRNNLTKLDLSRVTHLTELKCYGNQLTELDLSHVPHLTELNCGGNRLTELDLSGVPQITKIICGQNPLTELDLSHVHGLKELDCQSSALTELNLSHVPRLAQLGCMENQLDELDLSHVPHLIELNCGGNRLTELNLSHAAHLKRLSCPDNRLTELDLSHSPRLTWLQCWCNNFKELDIRCLMHLEGIEVSYGYETVKTRIIQRPDQRF